uniref:CD81 molecule n=1 Tax=Ursus maritimus TaxID=29073 RepID=A0A452TJ81_URSMA
AGPGQEALRTCGSLRSFLGGLGPSGCPGLGLGVGLDIHLRKKYPQDGHLGVQEGFWGSRLLTCKLRFPGLGGNCWPVTTVLSFCFCFLPVLELGRGPEWVQEPLSWPCPASLWPVPWAVPGTPLDPSAAPGCAPLLRKDHDNIQWTAQFSSRLGRVNFWNGPWSKCGAGDVCFPSGQPLAGGVILGVALWLRHDPQTTNLLYLELGDRPAPNTFYVGIYILIAVGAVMMFVGFLGCFGAIQESQCLLGTFFTCLVILFACEVAAGIWGFVNKDQIAKDVKQFYDQALQQAVVDDDANNAKAVVKTFHETLNCCGSSTLSALTTSMLKNNLCPSGSTVISNLFKEDCHQKIDDLFSGKLYLIGIAAIVVAVIMIFEMILSMVLCCGIRNSSVY